MNKNLNSFELGLLKRLLKDEKEKDKIYKILDKLEKEDKEEDLFSKSLIIKLARLREPIFMNSDNPSETFKDDDFVLFEYKYKKNEERYNTDIVYKGRCDLTDGFYSVVKINGAINDLEKRKTTSRFNKNNPYQLKHDDVAFLAKDYKIFITNYLKMDFTLEEAINKVIEKSIQIQGGKKSAEEFVKQLLRKKRD